MSQSAEERRGTRRFTLRLPVALHLPRGEAQAHTKDVSARGIYFYCDGETLDEGNPLDFTTLTSSVQVRCRGRAIRIEPEAGLGMLGVAAVIDDYQFLP
jgi:hypothetical protein